MWTKRSKGNSKERAVSDVGRASSGQTVVLREKVWRFEISRTKVLRFIRHHRVAFFLLFTLIVVPIFVRYALIGFASTADFYPSSCLGNWQNVANALGKPDVPPGSPPSAWNGANSAFFGTGTAQIFCGNFSGDADIASLQAKPFQNAYLILSWNFIFPVASSASGTASGTAAVVPAQSSTASSSPSVEGSGGGGGGVTGVVPAPTPTPDEASTSIQPPSPDEGTSTTASGTLDIGTGAVPATTTTTTTDLLPATPTPAALATTTVIAPTSTTDMTSTDTNENSITAPEPAPAPASVPDESSTTDTDSSPTSWLVKLVPAAYADESSSAPPAVVATATVPAPTGTMTVDTDIFKTIELPSSSVEDVLSIEYSTDGVTWQPVVNVNAGNWQVARYPIPIRSWDELSHLQVALVGLGSSSTPQVYLDSVGVEVNYLDSPDNTTDVMPSPAPETASESPSPPAPPPQNIPSPEQAFKNVFSPWAKQICSVDPFSASVARGDTVAFLLKLIPPEIPSSTKTSSAFMYDAAVGSLPTGVSSYLTTSAPDSDTIVLKTTPFAVPGSYTVVVVYHERQADGTVLPNYCQFNVVIR